MCVFPEGGTSNGRYLLAFKRGAFQGSRAVKPLVMKFTYGILSPAYDVAPFLPLLFMTLCLLGDFKVEVLELPTFVPNEYLYANHKDKVDRAHSTTWHQSQDVTNFYEHQAQWEPERWEIYAWAVRDVMSQASGLSKNEQPYREKLEYEAILGYREDGKPKKHIEVKER